MQINNFGFGAMATPQFDSGDPGYVSQAQATYDSSHDAGDLTFAQSTGGIIEATPGTVIGGFALLAIAAWFLLKR
jgi:hypothetical protein